MAIEHSKISSEMARTDRALTGEMGGHDVPRDPRVLCQVELIPGSQIQEPRQKLRGEYVVVG